MYYYITKDNADRTREKVKEINGTLEEAKKAFLEVIQVQIREYRVEKTLAHWRVIRLFDADNNQLAQES